MSQEARKAANAFRDLAKVAQAAILYPDGSEKITAAAERFQKTFAELDAPLRVSLLGTTLLVESGANADPAPLEALFSRQMKKCGWEALRVEKGAGAAAAVELARKLAAKTPPPLEGAGWSAGYLTFESVREKGMPVTNAAVGYMTLVNTSGHTLAKLGGGNTQGIETAVEVVSGIMAQIDGGRDFLGAMRSMKKFDEYTYTHALNVALLTSAVGKALKIPQKRLEEIALGALCHDVGKERVPREILHKPGKLTEDEKKLMDRHPVEGARMLIAMERELPEIVPVIAYEHHMSPQGGYPQALAGQRKHPASELVAVADVFDALRTARPYRPAKTTEEAFTILLGDARKGKLDKRLMEPLAGVLSLTRAGVKVRLTDNAEALIKRENPQSPLSPLVVRESGQELDLAVEKGIGIAGIFNPEE